MATAWIEVLNIIIPFTICLEGKKLQYGITEKKNTSEATRDCMSRFKFLNYIQDNEKNVCYYQMNAFIYLKYLE